MTDATNSTFAVRRPLAGARTPSPVRAARRPAGRRYIGIILPLGLLIVWSLATWLAWVPAVFLPSPLATVKAFVAMVTRQSLHQDFLRSINIVSQAFVYGSVAAVVLGVAAGLSANVERFFGPTFDSIRHIPGVAWLPLIVLWLGLGAPAQILVIGKSVFFPVFLNTLQGIRNVEKSHIELAKVLTLTRSQLIRRVVIPSAVPSIMVSLRYAAGVAWALVVTAEGLSGQEGLGYLIFRAQNLLITDQLIVCMVIIGLVGFAIDRLMLLLQRFVLRWKQGFEG
ncbi:ABC transporter permease [Ancylobacter sp. Lp-2]|uniref:ABC transporter permease n=1 Tax=Ancylobacter sp. Lp-2 TaxID=2881339 RepID=UPI001E557F38|nr:ABC transporter permease [Ancylobacter sp. Lp-2]MCB4769795.1 ABC transporter permease [Ancylobacter sp. Lp-2]